MSSACPEPAGPFGTPAASPHGPPGLPLPWCLTIGPLDPRAPRALPHHDDERRRAEDRFRALADGAPIPIFGSEAGLRLAYVNDAFAALVGATSESLLGVGWLENVHGEDLETLTNALQDVLMGAPREVRLRLRDGAGGWRPAVLRAVSVMEPGRPATFVGTVQDVTERRRFESALAYQAAHDALTGLPNRSHLLVVLAELLAVQPDEGLAVVLCDLDDFMGVNHALGHELGDRLLVEVAERLRGAVRTQDLVARLGGDEFVVLVRGVRNGDEARLVGERLLAVLRSPLRLGGRDLDARASCGVVVADEEHDDPVALLRDADLAMSRAKRLGKGQVVVFDPGVRAEAASRRGLLDDLRVAVLAESLEVVFQPVVEAGSVLDGGRQGPAAVVGLEALARWAHPTRGPISPVEFIPLAEENGLITQIGEFVLRRSCEQLVTWQRTPGLRAPEWVAVNLSAHQLASPTLAETVAAVLGETGLAGTALCLEVTETALLVDPELASASLVRLRALGVRVAIDDFGTGYSSLSLLARLPVDHLKIDRSFVGALDCAQPRAIVAAVVGLAQALGVSTVAEGVETPEQLAELRRLGCEFVQGWLTGRPESPATLTARLRAPVAPSALLPSPRISRDAVQETRR